MSGNGELVGTVCALVWITPVQSCSSAQYCMDVIFDMGKLFTVFVLIVGILLSLFAKYMLTTIKKQALTSKQVVIF